MLQTRIFYGIIKIGFIMGDGNHIPIKKEKDLGRGYKLSKVSFDSKGILLMEKEVVMGHW